MARIIAEGLTVRGVEDAVRELAEAGEPQAPESGTTTSTTRRTGTRRLPEPGLLELEEMLASFLNTRVKVDLRNRRGRLIVDFATLEDLERIYRTMVGNSATEVPSLPG